MSKRWTMKEDRFLVEFFEPIGANIGPHDLGRSEAATIKRVKKLKETGAWQALEHLARAERDYKNRYRECLGLEPEDFSWRDGFHDTAPKLTVVQVDK